ncbi:MAG: branched-chain amino acid aminotransferase [Alphaproteobacteria bacterium]|nr:branched-chain amino acid aminotransferase [Alphaproteobacteria bacterium]
MAESLIPFDDRDGAIWFNGKIIPWRDATIHFLSHGLHYASAVFEGERAYGGHIFESVKHSERLHNSARLLDFKVPFTVQELETAKYDVLRANGIVDGYVRPLAWRGAEEMGVSAHGSKINVAIAAWEWPSYFSPEMRAKGIRMKTGPWRRPDPSSAPTESKASGLYMICTLSKHAVEAEGYQDAMMLDWRGFVAEGTGANIFLIKDGVIHTPTPDCFLNGITRQTVLSLAEKRGIQIVERYIKPEDLGDFTEVFVTGTAAEVTPVGEIDQHRFTPGKITEALLTDYETLVRTPPAAVAAE